MPTLDPIKAAQDILRSYQEDVRNDSTNFLIYGGLGTGKTSLLRSCRAPVLVHSFDPGGSTVLKGESVPWSNYDSCVENGKILVDRRFEVEDPEDPKAFTLWDGAFEKLLKGKFFDHIGTFALDSGTTWAQSALYAILKKAKRAGGVPQQNDWFPQMTIMENAIRICTALPCDFIFLGHDDMIKDEVTGVMHTSLLITGRLKKRIPILFDEIYYATTKRTSKGTTHYLQTQASGNIMARTRLGKGGELEQFETPDIKAILKKVGQKHEDLPALINTAKEQEEK
jgi:hypothetical protein